MQIKFDFNNMMESSIGDKGISEKDIQAVSEKAADSYAYFEKIAAQAGWVGRNFRTIKKKSCAI